MRSSRLVGAGNGFTLVKFVRKPKPGLRSVVWNVAVKASAIDPDFHRRDLRNAIQSGDFPEWSEADEGVIAIEGGRTISPFIESCRMLRLWSRNAAVKL